MVKLFQTKFMIKLLKLLFFALVLNVSSCANKEEQQSYTLKGESKIIVPFEFGVWITANNEKSDEDYIAEFEKYKNAGSDEVGINTGTDP